MLQRGATQRNVLQRIATAKAQQQPTLLALQCTVRCARVQSTVAAAALIAQRSLRQCATLAHSTTHRRDALSALQRALGGAVGRPVEYCGEYL